MDATLDRIFFLAHCYFLGIDPEATFRYLVAQIDVRATRHTTSEDLDAQASQLAANKSPLTTSNQSAAPHRSLENINKKDENGDDLQRDLVQNSQTSRACNVIQGNAFSHWTTFLNDYEAHGSEPCHDPEGKDQEQSQNRALDHEDMSLKGDGEQARAHQEDQLPPAQHDLDLGPLAYRPKDSSAAHTALSRVPEGKFYIVRWNLWATLTNRLRQKPATRSSTMP